jgi:hypothetical protein
LVTDALLDTFPVSRYDASLAEVLREIEQYQELAADWDGEGALPVSRGAARLAAWLAQMVALTARHRGIAGRAPVVGPNADGGINLEWEGDDRQLFIILRPTEPHVVECVIEEAGAPPARQSMSIWDVIDQALMTIDER